MTSTLQAVLLQHKMLLCKVWACFVIAILPRTCTSYDNIELLEYARQLYLQRCGANLTCDSLVNEQATYTSTTTSKWCCENKKHCIRGCMPSVLCQNGTDRNIDTLLDPNITDVDPDFVGEAECTNSVMIASNIESTDESDVTAGYKLISRCNEQFQNRSVKDKCVTSTTDTVLDKTPVSSLVTFQTYKNFFCLQCNFLHNRPHVFWTVEMHLKKWKSRSVNEKWLFLEAFDRQGNISITTHMSAWANLHDVEFQLIARPKNKSMTNVMQCGETVYERCNQTGLVSNYDIIVEQVCKRLVLPEVVVFPSTRFRFSNLACILCNLPSSVPINMTPQCTIDQVDESSRDDVSLEFNVEALQPSQSVALDFPRHKRGDCEEGFIYDVVKRKCRQLHCPMYMRPHRGECQTIFSEIKRVTFKVNIGVYLRSGHEARTLDELQDFFLTMLNATVFEVCYGTIWTESDFNGNRSSKINRLIFELTIKPRPNSSYWTQLDDLYQVISYGSAHFSPIEFRNAYSYSSFVVGSGEDVAITFIREKKLPLASVWKASSYRKFGQIENYRNDELTNIHFTNNMICFRIALDKSEFYISQELLYVINTSTILSRNSYSTLANGDALACVSEYMSRLSRWEMIKPPITASRPHNNRTTTNNNRRQNVKPGEVYDDSIVLALVGGGIIVIAMILIFYCMRYSSQEGGRRP